MADKLRMTTGKTLHKRGLSRRRWGVPPHCSFLCCSVLAYELTLVAGPERAAQQTLQRLWSDSTRRAGINLQHRRLTRECANRKCCLLVFLPCVPPALPTRSNMFARTVTKANSLQSRNSSCLRVCCECVCRG